MGAARIRVTYELLRQVLCLPPETQITMTIDTYRAIEVTLTHPDLKDHSLGEPPLLDPAFRNVGQKVVFGGWNQE